jgi:DNA ligase (NAD+)
VPERRDGSERIWRMPAKCPVCHTAVERDEEGVAIYCPNVACPGRQLEGLVHFASRGAMDIRGLSYARIQQLLDAHLIHDMADIYTLTAEQISGLERFADRSAENLIAAIQTSRQQPLSRLINALGIRHVGEGAAQLLAGHFGTLDALASATEEQILEIRGIGDVIARSVTSYFENPSTRKLRAKLRRAGVNELEPRARPRGGSLTGMTVVITGTLPTLSRKEATQLVESQGGHVTGSVSRSTSFVVCGDDAGSKLDTARSLGNEPIDEAELLRRVGRQP